MSWGAIGSTVAGVAVTGLMNKGGGDGQESTQVQDIPEWMKPYVTGESDYRPQVDRPLSSDWLYWNYMSQQGMPVGPPPPMFVDDQRYTGEGVYDPPFQYQPMRTEGPGYGDPGPYGAPPPDTEGLLGGVSDYPSGDPNNENLVPAPAPAPEEEPPGPSAGDQQRLNDLARMFQNASRDKSGDDNWVTGGRNVDWGQAMDWALRNPEASDMDAYKMGLLAPYGGAR